MPLLTFWNYQKLSESTCDGLDGDGKIIKSFDNNKNISKIDINSKYD